jgi:hypothetical protein
MKNRCFEVRWWEAGNGSGKVLGPYTFAQALKLAQKLYKQPEVEGLSIQEVDPE